MNNNIALNFLLFATLTLDLESDERIADAACLWKRYSAEGWETKLCLSWDCQCSLIAISTQSIKIYLNALYDQSLE